MRRSLNLLSLVHLCHASHTSASETGILVTVAPAVNGSLDKTSLASEGNVELGQSPPNTVAIRLIHQTVTAILILGAACSGIDAVLLFELGGQLIDVDRLDITADGVLHLDPVPGILEGDPLHTVAILSDHERGSGRNRPRGRTGVDTRCGVSRALQLSAILRMVSLLHRG